MLYKLKFFHNIYYGWLILFIGGLGIFFSGPGQTYSNSQFIDEYIRDFGWSRSEVSSVYSIATLLAGLLMIYVGKLIDRVGQRAMMVIVGTLLSIACFYNSIVSSIWMLAIGFFFIRLLGQGSMSLIPNTLVAQWFIKRRGRAFSLKALFGFASAMSFPIINTALIQTWGWEVAWRFWGILIIIIFVPLAFFGVKNRPEMIGLEPDGLQPPNRREATGGFHTPIVEAEKNWTLAQAKRTKAFWAILICVGIPAMVNTGITFHITSIFNENGLSLEIAAMVLSLMAFVGIPMSLVSGYITDKVKTNYVFIVIFIIEFVLLLFLLVTKTFWLAIIFGILWGLAGGLERIAVGVVWPNYFGRKYIGSINGYGATVGVIGSSLGPLPFGVGFDLFQSYTPVLLATLIFPVLGLISAILAKKPTSFSD
ncbi:major facilitator superfamily protein [Gracilibacillus halophilus YIM-C55.5]|uniref:Major facilitator superfamily protein n=1 Tax=Gracilibacillus halophilus YIM-C55.5 TaxID=1308866 RepID=N4WF50_9BACI|nr:MFS transporter [Gracilibacillus halophilus]ENH97899.1 major facilitator superfamily protein [Gracilibacillus halophilus YIM-C55.5]